MYACTHTQQIYVHINTFSRPQKTSRLDRKFLFGMAVRSGLKAKIYRTPMLTTRAQCGGQTSKRCHVAETLTRQLKRMADTASLLSKPYRQAPFWKFLSVWRCRSLLSTSCLISGISCSPVRRRMRELVANRLLPPRAHTPSVCMQIKSKEISENVLNR